MDASSAETILRNATLLEVICLNRDRDSDHLRLCGHLAEHIVAVLVKIDLQRPKDDMSDNDALDDDWPDEDWKVQSIDRAALLTALTKGLISVEATAPLAQLIDHALSQSAKYDLTDAHLKAIFTLEAWLPRKLNEPNRVVSRWLKHSRTELEQRTARAPTPPADFRRTQKLSCKCGDCRQLSQFLADPHQSVLRLPLAKDRRQHLHQVIDACGCDLTHVTTRKGRPYTLVCTKTTASYENACKLFARDRDNLKRLQAIEGKIHRSTRT
jgi:hypothetical protein